MLAELPASVRTMPDFTLYAGDLLQASDLAGLEPPAHVEAAGEWVAYLNGREKDGEPLPVFVPFTVPLASSAPAAAVEQDLGWSVADVEHFVSWTNQQNSRCKVGECALSTTVAAGDFDDQTLVDLPEADDIASAGQGGDLSMDLANSTPARPQGAPLRMAVANSHLMASPYTGVVHDWLGPAQSLADDPALISMARVLDGADAYSAMMATPLSVGDLGIPEPVFDALGYSPADFPVFDSYAIGWSLTSGGQPEVTVVYHVPRKTGAKAAMEHVAERWAGRTLRGDEVSTLLELRSIRIEGNNVVVSARPGPGQGPSQAFHLTDTGNVPFLTR
jgi:hypothetical protein